MTEAENAYECVRGKQRGQEVWMDIHACVGNEVMLQHNCITMPYSKSPWKMTQVFIAPPPNTDTCPLVGKVPLWLATVDRGPSLSISNGKLVTSDWIIQLGFISRSWKWLGRDPNTARGGRYPQAPFACAVEYSECYATKTTGITQLKLEKDKTVLWVITFYVSLFVLLHSAAAARQQATQVTEEAAAGGQLTASHQAAVDSPSLIVSTLKIIYLADGLLDTAQHTRISKQDIKSGTSV